MRAGGRERREGGRDSCECVLSGSGKETPLPFSLPPSLPAWFPRRPSLPPSRPTCLIPASISVLRNRRNGDHALLVRPLRLLLLSLRPSLPPSVPPSLPPYLFPASVAVLRSREDGHHALLVHPLVPLPPSLPPSLPTYLPA